jgi:hypothetical protein
MLTGTLTIDVNCIWIADAQFRYLVLWPPGSQIAVSESGVIGVLGPGSSARLSNGDGATLVGGEYKDEEFVRQTIGSDIPGPCRSDRYWLATSVTNA